MEMPWITAKRILSESARNAEILQSCYVINERPYTSFRNSSSFDSRCGDIYLLFFFTHKPFVFFLVFSSFIYVRIGISMANVWKSKENKDWFSALIWLVELVCGAHVCESQYNGNSAFLPLSLYMQCCNRP